MSPADPAPLQRSLRDGVLVLTLDRPDRRNALSPALVEALVDAVQAAEADPDVAAIVIAAAGEHYCAGGDLGPGGLQGDGFLAQHQARGRFADLLQALVGASRPVVAAVQGDAHGGGVGLVAACHLVVLADHARLATPELRLGLFPWMIAPVLARKLPANLLHEMVLCGRKLSAAEAQQVGLANRVLPRDEVLPAALDLARQAASSSPAVRALGLQALAATADLPLPAALRQMHAGLSLNLMTEDAGEGIAAFLARRPPRWSGR